MPAFRVVKLLLPTLCLGAIAAAQDASPPRTPRPSLYEKALRRALEAAQQRALRDVDVHEDHSTWENAWEAKSDHFVVRTTRSYGEGMQLALGLETMLKTMQETLGIDAAPAQPIRVFVLPDRDAYNQFGNQYGAEHSSFYGSFFADQAPERPVAVAWVDNAPWLRMQVTHSVVHAYLAQVWPNDRPTWIDEGLAAYFSLYWDWNWGTAEFERLKQEKQLVPMRALLRDGIAGYTQNTHARLMQLAMLFDYLLRCREDTRTAGPDERGRASPFRDYLQALRTGKEPPAAVERLLDDPAQLERDLLAFDFTR